MNLIIMAPDKLEALFEQIEANQDIRDGNFSILGKDYIAMNYAKILKRFETLKQNEIPNRYVPLSFFQCGDIEFQELVRDISTDPELRIRIYVEEVLDMDYDKLKHR